VHPVTSRYGSIISVIRPAQLQFSHRLHLLSPDPESSLLMLCWNNNSWICFGCFVSLESLVYCCLLESLGFQRQGSLLENKSKRVTCLLKNFFFGRGGGRNSQLLSDQKPFKISHLFFHVQSSSLPKHTQGTESGLSNILKYSTSQIIL